MTQRQMFRQWNRQQNHDWPSYVKVLPSLFTAIQNRAEAHDTESNWRPWSSATGFVHLSGGLAVSPVLDAVGRGAGAGVGVDGVDSVGTCREDVSGWLGRELPALAIATTTRIPKAISSTTAIVRPTETGVVLVVPARGAAAGGRSGEGGVYGGGGLVGGCPPEGGGFREVGGGFAVVLGGSGAGRPR